MSRKETSAYKRGVADGRIGDGVQYSPFPVFSTQHDDWVRGYRSAEISATVRLVTVAS